MGEKIIELMWGSCLCVQCVKPVVEEWNKGPCSNWALITSHPLLLGTNRIMLNMWSASKTEHSTKADSIQLQWSLLARLLYGYTYFLKKILKKNRKSEAPPATCCFGDYLNEECPKDHFKHNITDLETLPGNDQIVLKWQAQIMVSDTSVTTICDYHKYKFGDKFVSKFKTANVCANIFSKHPSQRRRWKVVMFISLQMTTKLQCEGREATPGWQVCRSYDEVIQEPGSTASKQLDNQMSVFQKEINRSHVVFDLTGHASWFMTGF